jgi:hypothetical protein
MESYLSCVIAIRRRLKLDFDFKRFMEYGEESWLIIMFTETFLYLDHNMFYVASLMASSPILFFMFPLYWWMILSFLLLALVIDVSEWLDSNARLTEKVYDIIIRILNNNSVSIEDLRYAADKLEGMNGGSYKKFGLLYLLNEKIDKLIRDAGSKAESE